MHKIEGYFEAFLLIFLLVIFFIIIKPFILPMLLAATFVFALYKPYDKLQENVKNKNIAAGLIILMFILIISLPIYYLTIEIIEQGTYILSKSYLTGDILNDCSLGICNTITNNMDFIRTQLNNNINNIVGFATGSIASIFSSISFFIIQFFVFITALFFFLRDGKKFTDYLLKVLPMKPEYKRALLLRFRDTTSAIFFSYIFVGIVQGILMGILLMFLGFKTWVFIAILTAFLSMIPFSGPFLVWTPLSVYLFMNGRYVSAIILIILGFGIVSMSEDFLRPLFIRHRVKINFFLVFIGILGGLYSFGIAGLFIGPIVISLLVSLISLYKLDFK
ncbi:MAG: AI-2E family transporter [Nanoarchaeota archaeon]